MSDSKSMLSVPLRHRLVLDEHTATRFDDGTIHIGHETSQEGILITASELRELAEWINALDVKDAF